MPTLSHCEALQHKVCASANGATERTAHLLVASVCKVCPAGSSLFENTTEHMRNAGVRSCVCDEIYYGSIGAACTACPTGQFRAGFINESTILAHCTQVIGDLADRWKFILGDDTRLGEVMDTAMQELLRRPSSVQEQARIGSKGLRGSQEHRWVAIGPEARLEMEKWLHHLDAPAALPSN